jgi:D-tyrosyl-tRNA(Tyr) deacylase
VLLGVAQGDTPGNAERLAGKVARLRIFENDDGKFDRSLLDTGGAALVVSQFTLIADSRRQKGTRPDFSRAAPKEESEPIYETFCQALRKLGVHVETGVFGARMQLELVNDGPVTVVLDVGGRLDERLGDNPAAPSSGTAGVEWNPATSEARERPG